MLKIPLTELESIFSDLRGEDGVYKLLREYYAKAIANDIKPESIEEVITYISMQDMFLSVDTGTITRDQPATTNNDPSSTTQQIPYAELRKMCPDTSDEKLEKYGQMWLQ